MILKIALLQMTSCGDSNSHFGIWRLKSRLKGLPPTVGLRVHVGGRSANGSKGATSSRLPITTGQIENCCCGDDQAASLAKGEDFCRRAKVLDADLALFPEMWNIGYTFFNPSKASEPGARAYENMVALAMTNYAAPLYL